MLFDNIGQKSPLSEKSGHKNIKIIYYTVFVVFIPSLFKTLYLKLSSINTTAKKLIFLPTSVLTHTHIKL